MVAPFRTTGVLLLAFLALLSTCTPLPLPLPLPQPMRSGTPASTAESSSAKSAANRPVEKWVREHPAEALATTAAGSAVLALLGHAGLSSFANFASEREAAIARRVPRAWGNVSQADRALENLRHLLRKDQETGNGEFGRCFRAQLSSLSLAQEFEGGSLFRGKALNAAIDTCAQLALKRKLRGDAWRFPPEHSVNLAKAGIRHGGDSQANNKPEQRQQRQQGDDTTSQSEKYFRASSQLGSGNGARGSSLVDGLRQAYGKGGLRAVFSLSQQQQQQRQKAARPAEGLLGRLFQATPVGKAPVLIPGRVR